MKVNKKLGMMTMALSLSGLLVACGEDETTNTDTNMSDDGRDDGWKRPFRDGYVRVWGRPRGLEVSGEPDVRGR